MHPPGAERSAADRAAHGARAAGRTGAGPAILDLVINGGAAREVFVLLRDADVLTAVSDLRAAGLDVAAGPREAIDGQPFVALSSLRPEVTFAVNERDLRLDVTAPPQLLGRQVRDLRTRPPADLVYRSHPSAFVNYSLTVGTGSRYNLFTESAASVRGALLYNTFSSGPLATVRGLSNVTVDQRSHLRRFVVGDSFAHTGPLGGDAWIAGISVSREFSLDPYFVRQPQLAVSAPVTAPSLVEVYVNGRLVSQERMAPGMIDVRNLPLTTGRNDARVIVRDPFGGVQELSSNYYLTASALAPGLHDYHYSFGFRREQLGTSSWAYSLPVALARHRVGLTPAITAGGRVEAGHGLFAGGPTLNLRLPFGEAEAAAGVSRSAGRWGSALLGAFTYSGRPVSAGGSVTVASEGYATLRTPVAPDRVAVQGGVFGTLAMNRYISLTLQHGGTRQHDGITHGRSSITLRSRVHPRVNVSVSAARERTELGRSTEVLAGLTVLFGSASVTAGTLHDPFGTRGIVEAQQSLPTGTGYGYHLRAETGAHDRVALVGRYQNRFGRYEVRHDDFGGGRHSSATVTGALVGIGGNVYATRPVQDSFALLRVPGVEGVRGYASFQTVGRTNASGDLLVPNLRAYYGNRLAIADTDVPIDYAISDTGLTLALPYRGGAIATFPVHRIQRVMGSVRIAAGAGTPLPSYGELTVTAAGIEHVSPVGLSGAFYFENLPPGRHAAVFRTPHETCTFTLDVPVSSEDVITLPDIRCIVPARPVRVAVP